MYMMSVEGMGCVLLCVCCVSLRGVICDTVLKQVNMEHSVLCVLCTYVNWSM